MKTFWFFLRRVFLEKPGLGCCRCARPWGSAKPHQTKYWGDLVSFALCEPCWRALTPEKRWPFYRRALHQWDGPNQHYHVAPEQEEALRIAVLDGE